MKKRKGIQRLNFNGEIVCRPIDPDLEALPVAYYEDGDNVQWVDGDPTNECAKQEWREAQDGLNKSEQQANLKKGRAAKAGKPDKVVVWLYPMLAAAYSALVEKNSKQLGWRKLQGEVLKHDMKPRDPRKKYVTRTRIEKWLKEERPYTV